MRLGKLCFGVAQRLSGGGRMSVLFFPLKRFVSKGEWRIGEPMLQSASRGLLGKQRCSDRWIRPGVLDNRRARWIDSM